MTDYSREEGIADLTAPIIVPELPRYRLRRPEKLFYGTVDGAAFWATPYFMELGESPYTKHKAYPFPTVPVREVPKMDAIVPDTPYDEVWPVGVVDSVEDQHKHLVALATNEGQVVFMGARYYARFTRKFSECWFWIHEGHSAITVWRNVEERRPVVNRGPWDEADPPGSGMATYRCAEMVGLVMPVWDTRKALLLALRCQINDRMEEEKQI